MEPPLRISQPVGAADSPDGSLRFELLGYDLVEVDGSISALSNCGGFPDVFSNDELSRKGLLISHGRAQEVQSKLRIVPRSIMPTAHLGDCENR